jgi:hypothetical protein
LGQFRPVVLGSRRTACATHLYALLIEAADVEGAFAVVAGHYDAEC